jgi:hypothetical protein
VIFFWLATSSGTRLGNGNLDADSHLGRRVNSLISNPEVGWRNTKSPCGGPASASFLKVTRMPGSWTKALNPCAVVHVPWPDALQLALEDYARLPMQKPFGDLF